MKPVPLLFLSDSPEARSGLARISRDLACLASTLPEFRVGFLGRGGHGSSQLPFAQFNYPSDRQWGEQDIETVWQDFAGNDPGIIFTIFDASRLAWFAHPVGINGSLGRFLRSGRFQRWGYFPVDSTGVGGRLTALSAETIARYDRVLAYGIFGAGVIGKTIGREVDWIPHGMNLDIFQPRDKTAARMAMGVPKDALLIGMVATNQVRKDWGCAFATIAQLKNTHPNLVFWTHTDIVERHWDLRALAADFHLALASDGGGLARGSTDVILTIEGQFNDTEMSYGFSACDLTILPSSEGFGLPIVESLACGVPVIHSSYGGGAELIPNPDWLVNPVFERLETPHNCLRPVFDPRDWVAAIERVLAKPPSVEECRNATLHLFWKDLWPATWKKWFLAGLNSHA